MAKKPPVKVNDQEIINAITDCHGNLRMAAGKLKIAYGTLISRMKHCPEARQAKLNAVCDMITIAEDNILNELLSGNWQASKFVLERLNREKWGNGNANQVAGDPIEFAQAEDTDGE